MSYNLFWDRVEKLQRAYETAPEDMKYIWYHKLYAIMLNVKYYQGLTMSKIYGIIQENWLLIFLSIMLLWVSAIAFNQPAKDNKTIIQIEIDLDKIDGSLKSIEDTIEEIFGKLEIEIKTGD